MKNKALYVLLPIASIALMAFTVADQIADFTDEQETLFAQRFVEIIKRSYTQDKCSEENSKTSCPTLIENVRSKANLGDILGSLPETVFPIFDAPRDRDWTDEEDQKRSDTVDAMNEGYPIWVKLALRNRGIFINAWTTERMLQVWEKIDEEAIKNKLDYSTRKKFFADMGKSVLYYRDSLSKLAATTPAKRKEILDLAAKVSPRSNVYRIQQAYYENVPSELTKSVTLLRSKLKEIGINAPELCDDFYDYKFTRYSRTYDYLFAITRWAAQIDNGTFTEEKISGYNATTLDTLVAQGSKMATRASASLNKYEIRQ